MLASEKAIKGITDIEAGEVVYSKKNNPESSPYYEHIEPKCVTYDKLLKIKNPTGKNIRKVLQYCKIILITKDESKYLDFKEHNTFNEEDEKLLRKWLKKNYITEEIFNNSKESIIKNDVYNSSKDNGSAYARLAHLVRHGVTFKWLCNPDKTPNIPQGKLISQYLESNDRVYQSESDCLTAL